MARPPHFHLQKKSVGVQFRPPILAVRPVQQEGVEIGPLQAVSRTYSFHFLIRSTVDTKFQVVLLYRIRLSVVVAVLPLCTRAGNGSVGHGSWVKWVTKTGWVTWVMGHWVLTHDPSDFQKTCKCVTVLPFNIFAGYNKSMGHHRHISIIIIYNCSLSLQPRPSMSMV
jgi:hypothetical protein